MMEMEEEVKTLSDYLHIIRRRKYLIVIPMLLLLGVTVIVAMILPPIYRSEATILIEQQHIPTDLVKSTVSSFAEERIKHIEQRVMTVDNINKIIDKYNLYSKLAEKSDSTGLAEEFRENAELTLVNANVVQHGRAHKATLAFKLAFSHRQGAVAQKIANELVTLFLNENIKNRTERASETTRFLEEEAEKFKQNIQRIENQIAEYKQKYSESLPELLSVNMASIDRIETEMQQLELKEKMLNERRVSLRTQLAITTPTVMAVGGAQPAAVENLSLLQAQYEQLLTKYSPSHPDVKALKRRIDNFEGESNENAGQTEAQGANNPVYLQLASELKIADIELGNIYKQKLKLKQDLSQLEQRVSQTHQVERGYYDLMRDLDNHKAKYKELKAKALEAKLAQTLEEEQKAEKFSLIEPPRIPSKAEKPNRFKILLMGFVASVGAGIGTGFLAEMLDDSVRGHKSLASLTGVEPLVVIPYIKNDEDLARTRRNIISFSIISGVLLVGAITAIHFLYIPLDILWLKLWNRLGML